MILMSLTYCRLSNLITVDQVVMGTIKPLPYQFFCKKGTKDSQTGNAQSML